jgi:hypothetical protein
MFAHSVGFTDGLLEIDVKSFCVIYTHSMIDVSKRRIMYGTYCHVRSVPRPGMFFCYCCVAGCSAHAGSIQNHTTDYIVPLDRGVMSLYLVLKAQCSSLSVERQSQQVTI